MVACGHASVGVVFEILCNFLDLIVEYVETIWVYSKAIMVISYIVYIT